MNSKTPILEIIVDEEAGYVAKKFINEDGYLFDRHHDESTIGKPAWVVHRIDDNAEGIRRHATYYRTHKGAKAFLRHMRQVKLKLANKS